MPYKFIVILFVVMVIGTLPACSNTANGAGKDMENMGRWIQDRT